MQLGDANSLQLWLRAKRYKLILVPLRRMILSRRGLTKGLAHAKKAKHS